MNFDQVQDFGRLPNQTTAIWAGRIITWIREFDVRAGATKRTVARRALGCP